jgi:MSHA biogenesis protein MshQ
MLLCVLCLAQARAQAGEVHAFDGNRVKGCQLDGKAYTCGNLPSTASDDSMVIADGFSVHIRSSVNPGWDYGVSMSGSARLTSGGSINLNGINPAKISISGGSFDAAGEFTLTRPVRVTANVTAGTITLGGEAGFQITGNMVSKGAVSVATSAIVNGSVSGGQVTLGSSVRVSGSLVGTGAVSIGSSTTIGAGVSGSSITADSSVTVTGNVASTGAVSIGSSGIVNGSVSGAQVTTNSSVKISGSVTATGKVSIGSSSTVGADVTGTSITTDASVTITGTVKASDVLTVGSHSTIRGPVSGANSITLNSPSTIVGTVTSKGPITIGSHANINGAISGTIVTTGSPVTLKGDIVATSRFTLASGSTVNGNITSPEIEMYAASSIVTGKVTASKYLTMGHAVRINGDVDTGQLKLEAADALINGNATVDFATLYWHGRVSEKIFCKKGTRPGYCDCVDNQSDYPVNTANGPRCEAPKPATGALDHFLISHDGSGSVCAPETVTVSACANADCSSKFTGGAQVTLFPGNVSADTGSTGTVKTTVARSTVGTEALRLTDGAAAVRCYNSATGKADCNMAFSGGVVFEINAEHFKAGAGGAATITAKEFNEQSKTCVAAFQGQEKQIGYACRYNLPDTGTQSLSVTPKNGNASAALACSASGAVQTLTTKFSTVGMADVTLAYEDAGRLTLRAIHEGDKNTTADDASGEGYFDVAPDKFGFANLPSKPVRAGDEFTVTVQALSRNGNITKNFSRDGLPAGATTTDLSIACLFNSEAQQGTLNKKPIEFANGQASASPSWTEVGSMHLKASTSKTFLDSGTTTTGVSGADAACASVGPFIPHHFLVEHRLPLRAPNMFYAGEPIPITVTAKNKDGGTTLNYSKGFRSEDVSIGAVDKDEGITTNPNGGVVTQKKIEADAFQAGVASADPAYGPAKTVLLAPTHIRLRASNDAADADNMVSSAASADHEKATPEIRSGRLRIATLFGRAGSTLKLPITAEYWSGNSWLLNNKDDFTIVPAAAIAQTSHAHANGNGAKPKTQVFSDLSIKGGKAELPVQGDTAGWIDIAFNLGAGTTQDQSCLKSHPATTAANLPWLQSLSGCTDPSGRATFGIFAPESRRIIHVREVFN